MSAKTNSSTSMWLKFFRAAGINPGIDTKYALIFDENRIRMTMLMDIDKECLKDMGIVAMGDIIAILKHARKIHEETKEQAVETKPSQSISPDPPPPPAPSVTKISSPPPPPRSTAPLRVAKSVKVTTNNVNSKLGEVKSATTTLVPTSSTKSSVVKSSAASRPSPQGANTNKGLIRVITTKNLTASYPGEDKGARKLVSVHDLAEKKIIVLNKRSSSEIVTSLREEVPVQKKIRVLPEHEGKYKIKMPEGTTPRTQKIIQNRLGPALSEVRKEEKKTVFDRLGDSRVSSSTEVKQLTTSNIISTITSHLDGSSDRSHKGMSSVFDRLGDRGKEQEDSSLQSSTSKISLDNTSKSSIRFEVRQDVIREPQQLPPILPQRLTESRHNAYTEKTLVTIPSRISIPYMTNKYRLKSEISSPAASSSGSSSSLTSSPSTSRLISTKHNSAGSSQPLQQNPPPPPTKASQQHSYFASSFVRGERQQVEAVAAATPATAGEEIVRIKRPPADLHNYVPDDKSLKMMGKMGWSPGRGLGKECQGRKYAIDGSKTRAGNFGLGYFTIRDRDQQFKYI